MDQLKVQVTPKPALKLNGERQITGNRWHRFHIEFPIPSDYDLENVSATFEFEGSKLHVKFAKLVKPKETTNPPEETSRPKEPSQNVDQQNAAQEVTPKAKEDKVEARTNNEVSDQNKPQKEKEKEPSDAKEKSKPKTEASIDKVAQEEGKTNNGITEKIEAATTKAPETKDAKPITRFKTRLLDFTLSLGPSNRVYNEELGDLVARANKRKKLVTCGVLTLLVVGLGLCAKNAFTSSDGGSKSRES